MKNLTFKVQSKKTGAVYLPDQIAITIRPEGATAQTLEGDLIEEPLFMQYAEKADSNKRPIFDRDVLLMEYPADNERVAEKVVVRESKGCFYLCNPNQPRQSSMSAIPLSLVPSEMKLTIVD